MDCVAFAAHHALYAERHGRRKASHLHAQVLFELAATRSVGDAFSSAGMQASSTRVLLVGISVAPADWARALALLDGDIVHDISAELAKTDPSRVMALYGVVEEELRVGSLVDAVLTAIATRSVHRHGSR